MSNPASATLPTLFIPHGGGPCFFMEWSPPGTWDRMAAWLRSLIASLETRPKAILVISGHWEAPVFTVGSSPKPRLIYDYNNFPRHTYQLRYDAPGSPDLARRVRELLASAGIASDEDAERGYDHGVFIPLKVALRRRRRARRAAVAQAGAGPRPALGGRRGAAAAARRRRPDRGQRHELAQHARLQSQLHPQPRRPSDAWLSQAVSDTPHRDDALRHWEDAPLARQPIRAKSTSRRSFVAAGAAQGEAGRRIFSDIAMDVRLSGFSFGEEVGDGG